MIGKRFQTQKRGKKETRKQKKEPFIFKQRINRAKTIKKKKEGKKRQKKKREKTDKRKAKKKKRNEKRRK